MHIRLIILVILVSGFYCVSFPIYEALIIEKKNISESLFKPDGFSSDENFFYILDVQAGDYDEATGLQNYIYIHLNVYNKTDFSLEQFIDLTTLYIQLVQDNLIKSDKYLRLGPLVYHNNRILFNSFLDDEYRYMEYNIDTGGIRLVNDFPKLVYFWYGYNPDKNVLWIDDDRKNEILEYSINLQNNNFILMNILPHSTYLFEPVYMNNAGVWSFTEGVTFIDSPCGGGGDQSPDSFRKYENLENERIYESNIPLNYSCLPQIIPEGDIVWAVCEDKNDGKYYILKLDPFGGQPPPGCDSQEQAFSLPSYFQNFGLLAVALGYFGFRRKKKRL
jgi:hypothetical protein